MTIFTELDRKFPWSFLGFLAGVTFGLFGIYTVFFYDKFPVLDIQIANDAPVFSVREQVPELDILFQGSNIREAHQGLAVVTIKISNQGKAPIRASDFDAKDPLTISLANGKIIKVDMTDSSEDYFKNVFDDFKTTDNTITLPPFIMEQGRFMSIRVLALHEEKSRPQFSVGGKIAGINQLIVKPCQPTESHPVRLSVLRGDIAVQGIRVLVYGGSLIGTIVLVITLTASVSRRINRQKRKQSRIRRERALAAYLQERSPEVRNQLRPFARLCVEDDFAAMHLLSRLIRNSKDSPEEFLRDEEMRMILGRVEMLDPRFDARHFELTSDLVKHIQDMLKFLAKNM